MPAPDRPPRARVTVDWPDLGYTCVASVRLRSSDGDRPIAIDWTLYTFYDGRNPDGTAVRMWQRAGSDSWCDPITSFDEAAIYIEGDTKWDGCTNWQFFDRETMQHACGRTDLVNLGVLLARVHDLCGEMMPDKRDFDPEPLPESPRWEDPIDA